MTEQFSHRRLLLVTGNDTRFSTLQRLLEEKGYWIESTRSYTEACRALYLQHFHLAIVDLTLIHEGNQNDEGLMLLRVVEKENLFADKVMPCVRLITNVILRGFSDNWRELKTLDASKSEPDGSKALLESVEDFFAGNLKLNTTAALTSYTGEFEIDIEHDLDWLLTTGPLSRLLTFEIREVFARFFTNINSFYVEKFISNSVGATILRVEAILADGRKTYHLMRIGQSKKIQLEADNLDNFVFPYLDSNMVHIISAFTRHTGALLYTFADGSVRLTGFDKFYWTEATDVILSSLRYLFQNTFREWYDDRKRIFEDLLQYYSVTFQLSRNILIKQISCLWPQFDPDKETFRIDDLQSGLLNPVHWLSKYHAECVLPVYQCVTHGNLVGHNIVISDETKSWVLDFLQTGKSHILRDFVVLETDIKYRLSPTIDLMTFIMFEQALLQAGYDEIVPTLEANWPEEIQKAARVIVALRQTASAYSISPEGYKESTREYFVSLLFATLRMITLPHIQDERKRQAIISSALICGKLNSLSGRSSPIVKKLSHVHRHLSEYLNEGNLNLFIGSAPPLPSDQSWPTMEGLSLWLKQKMGIPRENSESYKMLTYYNNVYGDRAALIGELINHFESIEPAPFFKKIVGLPWRAIYTTNQHTYLERSCDDKSRYRVIVSVQQRREVGPQRGIPLYKLYGCLSPEYRLDKSLRLLEQERHEWLADEKEKRNRNGLTGRLVQDLIEGRPLLMLYASEEELSLARSWNKELKENYMDSSIWLAAPNLSGYSQKYHEEYLQIVPNTPSELLTALASLISK